MCNTKKMSEATNKEIYNTLAHEFARAITKQYSTSFASATRLIGEPKRTAIYDIYGYVRLADEIVDTWRPDDMTDRLQWFEQETRATIKTGYSTNPIIHAFGLTAKQYGIKQTYIDAFLKSMRMDIHKTTFNEKSYREYIYGSAEVVGLMCLQVFCEGQQGQVNKLTPGAQALGAAFQKVNFLRDLSEDQNNLKRYYFPNLTMPISEADKQTIIREIKKDFEGAQKALEKLPPDCRSAVWLAYRYYLALTRKISKTPVGQLTRRRASVNNGYKTLLFGRAWLRRGLGR